MRSPRSRAGFSFTPYAEITHLSGSQRGLWLGTRHTVLLLRGRRFPRDSGPIEVAERLRAQILRRPGGEEQIARFARIEELSRRSSKRIAIQLVALACVLMSLLQLRDGFVYEVGVFLPDLVRQGEFWRVLTANFLHASILFPLHLGLNVLGLLAFAFLVERPLGALRSAVVMGAAALGAMGGSALAGHSEVVGASGIVMGLAGATLCLELHFAEYLPATWRLPRRLFLAALAAEALIGFWVPVIAGAAHLGGFLAGYAATGALSATALRREPVPYWVRASALALGLALLSSLTAAAPLVFRDADALTRHGRNLLETRESRPGRLNDLAWRMVTEAELRPSQLEVALALAESAVERTERAEPALLDTLAEVLFARGEPARALATIDEAIVLAPLDDYFRQQQRRFTGERAGDDRPEPPGRPRFERRPTPERSPSRLGEGVVI
ncbi:MAG: rhomboid family intramembrane serine protease [Myxococcota bacterium]